MEGADTKVWSGVPSLWKHDYKEITLFRQWKQKLKQWEEKMIPTCEERSDILLNFYDTYNYFYYIGTY